MDETQALSLLKHNLQRSHTSAQDDYLSTLLVDAERELEAMGLIAGETRDSLKIDYAAFLFRSRADVHYSQTMPRYLDRRIKNALIHQAGVS